MDVAKCEMIGEPYAFGKVDLTEVMFADSMTLITDSEGNIWEDQLKKNNMKTKTDVENTNKLGNNNTIWRAKHIRQNQK